MKELNKIPKITGRIPPLYDRQVIGEMCMLLNAHSDAINYLNNNIKEQQEQIEELKKKIKQTAI